MLNFFYQTLMNVNSGVALGIIAVYMQHAQTLSGHTNVIVLMAFLVMDTIAQVLFVKNAFINN